MNVALSKLRYSLLALTHHHKTRSASRMCAREAPNVGGLHPRGCKGGRASAPEHYLTAKHPHLVEENNSNNQREEDHVHCQEEQRRVK